MRVTLTFDLPDEKYDLVCALKGMDYKLFLCDLEQYLRGQVKYSDANVHKKQAYEEIRHRIWEDVGDVHKEDW